MPRRPALEVVLGLVLFLSTASLRGQTSWTAYYGNPLIAGGTLDPSVVYDSAAGRYSIWFVTPAGVVRQGSSSDGLVWSLADTPALFSGPAGSYDQLITSVSVVKNQGTYFMYYTAYGPSDSSTIGLATATDGVHWKKNPNSPVLRPGGAGTWEYPKVTGARVVVANGTFYMTYSGYNGANQDAGLAVSIDGITWFKSPSNPVLVHGDPSSLDGRYLGAAGMAYRNGTFYLIYRATNIAGYSSYCLATSPNGVQWQKFSGNPLYAPAGYGWDGFQIGGGSLLWSDNGFKFWYCATGGSTWATGLAYLSRLIAVNPAALDFGPVRVGSRDTMGVVISNSGITDTLQVSSVSSNNPVFSPAPASATVPPGGVRTIQVVYRPAAAGHDTGTISIECNDPSAPVTRCRVTGRGFVPVLQPVIDTLYVVPRTYYQIRVAWFRSVLDTPGAADQITQYSLWRMVPGARNAVAGIRPPAEGALSSPGPLWDFIQAIPSAGFDVYSTVIPAFVDYTIPGTLNVFMVAAHTRDLKVYLSDPDSVLVDPPQVTGASEGGSTHRASDYSLDQNYPNPFNPSTIIRYSLARASGVRLAVFTTLGQEVALLVDSFQGPGPHEVRFDARGIASGVYFYRLSAGGFVQSRRLLLLR